MQKAQTARPHSGAAVRRNADDDNTQKIRIYANKSHLSAAISRPKWWKANTQFFATEFMPFPHSHIRLGLPWDSLGRVHYFGAIATPQKQWFCVASAHHQYHRRFARKSFSNLIIVASTWMPVNSIAFVGIALMQPTEPKTRTQCAIFNLCPPPPLARFYAVGSKI